MAKHTLISSQRVKGTNVYGPDDTKVGQIEAIIIEKIAGRVRYAVMSFGGFLGIGQDQYPIPWAALKYDPAVEGYRTGITEDQLRSAPQHGAGFWGDRDWESRVHGHYGKPGYWELGAQAV